MSLSIPKRNIQMVYKGIACALLGLFLFYYAGVSLFTHVHHFGSVTLVHSHPFAHPFAPKADNPLHQHSQEQIQTLHNLDYLIFTLSVVGIICIAPFVFRHVSLFVLCVPSLCKKHLFFLRGPPSFV